MTIEQSYMTGAVLFLLGWVIGSGITDFMGQWLKREQFKLIEAQRKVIDGFFDQRRDATPGEHEVSQ